MEAGGLATGYAYDCRAGASPADPSNGKRERLPYKSVVESEVSDQTSDRVKASLTRRSQRSDRVKASLTRLREHYRSERRVRPNGGHGAYSNPSCLRIARARVSLSLRDVGQARRGRLPDLCKDRG